MLDLHKDDEDLFGLSYNDNTEHHLGYKITPSYSHYEITGKFTGEVKMELSVEEAKLLNLNAVDVVHYLVDKVTSL